MRIRPSPSGLQISTTLSCALSLSLSHFLHDKHLHIISLKHRSEHCSDLTSLCHSLGVEPKPEAQNPICLRLCVTRPHIYTHTHTLTLNHKDCEEVQRRTEARHDRKKDAGEKEGLVKKRESKRERESSGKTERQRL